MVSDDDLPRSSLVTYRRSHRVEDEETVPDSEDSAPPRYSRPPDDDSSDLTKTADSDPPRPPRAVYRSRNRAVTPPPLSYSSIAPAEEVIPDSEDNVKTADTSDDDNDETQNKSPPNTRKSVSLGHSDWRQKLRDIDDQYDTDEHTQPEIPSAVPDPKGGSPEDPFGSPLTTEASSQHASHHLHVDDSLSSPSRGVSSSTNTTPQFLFGTPHSPPTPPTSDGKPSPMPKTATKAKGKDKARAPPEAQEAAIDDQLASSSGAIRSRRSEKPKKSKAPTKKELREARRETARMRSDMRASISTDATRHLDIKDLLKRFDVNQPAPSARPLQPQSSVSEIEAWPSSSPASVHELGYPGTHQDEDAETSEQGRRSASPFRSTGLLAPTSKYKVAPATDDDDDPFRVPAPSVAPKKITSDRDAGSDSSSDVEMPGIGEIIAAKEARESQRIQKERLQQLKRAVLAKQQQKRESTNTDALQDIAPDSDDDELDVVPDTMHSVAREEASARAAAGHMRPSTGRTTQLRFAGVAASPQRSVAIPLIPSATESPEKRMSAAAQSSFLASSRSNGAGGRRGKRGAGMTKAELERMVLRNAEVQSEQLRREKENEWVRRGGRVVGVMEAVGDEKVLALIGDALKRDEGSQAQGDGDDDAGSDDDDEDDADYVPVERGSASPQPIKSQNQEGDEDAILAEEMMAYADGQPDDEAAATTEADSETESSAPATMRMRRSRTVRPRRGIIGSDDEDGPSAAGHADDEDVHPPPLSLSLPDLPSPAFSSTTSPWPTRNVEQPDHDHEHENDPYVSGNETDKENRAVGPAPAPTHGARVLFDDILSARTSIKAGVQPQPLLQPSVLLADDDPFAFTPSPAKVLENASSRLASPTARHLTGKRGLSQMFEEEEGGAPVPALMIHGSDGDSATPGDGLVGFKPILGGLSQAFEQTQDAPGPGMGGLAALRRGVDAELSLTFEAQAAALQPALEVDDHLRARAAAIFEKEQEYVMEAARPAQSGARRELYITENGFLTQTRPEGSSPLVYRPSPSQRPYDALLRSQSEGALGPPALTGTAASSPLVTRQPLSTLAETSPSSSSVRREPLRRLRRAHTSPDGPSSTSPRSYGYTRGPSLSPSPSPSPTKTKGLERTAFTELMTAAAQRDKAKGKKRSEFVEDQAAESDEDDMLGFGGMRKKKVGEDEEDEDDHDTDGVVEALVDDAAMDAAALAEAKVVEKHMEHQAEDDTRLEKEVQDVVAGKRRTRRRGGAGGLLGSDESDDEDDEEARALRQRLAKKRRVAGDTLDALARNPATASFHATYQMALLDDAEEFAHLDRDQELQEDEEPGRDRTQDREGGEREEDEEGDVQKRRGEEGADEDVEMADSELPAREEKRTRKEEISAAEVRKALQEVARGEREYRALDPEDVSWMDQELAEADEAETSHMRVRLAPSTNASKVQPHRAQPTDADMDVVLNRTHADKDERQDAAYAQRMKRWANEEGARAGSGSGGRGGGRNTSRGVGAGAGAAVTGHRPRTAKSTSTGPRSATAKGKAKASSSVDPSGPAIRKTTSALSAFANRRGRFGD